MKRRRRNGGCEIHSALTYRDIQGLSEMEGISHKRKKKKISGSKLKCVYQAGRMSEHAPWSLSNSVTRDPS